MTPSDSSHPIDWNLTTWEGSRREQLRRWAALPLDRVIAALEEMAELAESLGSPPPARQRGENPAASMREGTDPPRPD